MTANLGGFSIQTHGCPIESGVAWTLEGAPTFHPGSVVQNSKKKRRSGRDDGGRTLMQPSRRAAPILRWSGSTGPVACRTGGQPRPKQISPIGRWRRWSRCDEIDPPRDVVTGRPGDLDRNTAPPTSKWPGQARPRRFRMTGTCSSGTGRRKIPSSAAASARPAAVAAPRRCRLRDARPAGRRSGGLRPSERPAAGCRGRKCPRE